MTIPEIIRGRDLIPWQDLAACYRESRGLGVCFRTIQAWQAQGMPYVQDGRKLLFSWPESWEWYKLHFAHVRKAS